LFAVLAVTGTHTGTLSLPGTPAVQPSNRKLGMLWFDAVAFENSNRIMREAMYRDPATLLSQIGALPKEPHRAAADEVPEMIAVATRSATENANAELVQATTVAFDKHDAAAMYAHASDDLVESDQTRDKDSIGAKRVREGTTQLFAAFADAKRAPCAKADQMCWTGYNGSSRLSDLVAADQLV